ncbi:MAG TPA: DUF4445 domain-containing protein [Methanomicrobia archaeon]|nr:DUF4445 domain-containing protein [Methanomicrobia archaeon]
MKIVFTDSGIEADLVADKTILSYAQELGIEISAPCGGEGTCGQCLIEVLSTPSALSRKTTAERQFIRNDGHRLACQARVRSTEVPIYIRIPRIAYCILETSEFWPVQVDPFVHREGDRVFYESTAVNNFTGEMHGIALDIGTTTLVLYLIDLETGAVLSVISRENPQKKYGNNVISRIEFARTGQQLLEREIRIAVNEMIAQLTERRNVYELVVVGNPVMRDLFFGTSVQSLGITPYEPLSTEPVRKTASELGLALNPNARVYGLPLVGSFVGSDALAVVLATEMYKHNRISMVIDIGTNTEIVLGNRNRLIATSCAAGPAFEGCSVQFGLGGVSGAINEVRLVNGTVTYRTIHHAKPIGICGSGLIDALAVLLENRIINGRGKFLGDTRAFHITDTICLFESDIDKLNLAKSAVSVGIKVLLERYGIELTDLDHLYLAGAFGYYINLENAMRIGLLPPIALEKVEKVGNAAIEGARHALISRTKRKDAETVAPQIEHIKLDEVENFQEKFIGELYFQNYLYGIA